MALPPGMPIPPPGIMPGMMVPPPGIPIPGPHGAMPPPVAGGAPQPMGTPNAGPPSNTQPLPTGQARMDGPGDSHEGPPGMDGPPGSRGLPNQHDRNGPGMMQNRPGMNRGGRDGPPVNPERMEMMVRDGSGDRGRGPPGRGGHMDHGRGGGPMRGGRPLIGRGGPMGMDGPPLDQDGRPMRRDNRPTPYGRPPEGPRNMRNRGEPLEDEQIDGPFPPSMRGGRGRAGFRR